MEKRAALIFMLTLCPVVALAQVPLDTLPFWQSSETGVYSTGMVWRDCNLDGWIDVFYSNGNDMALAPNTVYLSDGGSLPTAASWSSANAEYSGHCAVGDIDDNGYPDFAVANYLGSGRFSTANQTEVYFNYGGTLATSSEWHTADSIYSFSCALADVDNDGDLDLALATGEAYTGKFQRDLIYFNQNGVLDTIPGWRSSDSTTAYDVTFGDVDNDGDLDMAFCYEGHPTALYLNQGGVMDTMPSWQSSLTQSGNTLIFAEVNGDGWLDLIVAYNSQLASGGQFAAYLNDGGGHLSVVPLWQSATGGYGSALAVYDYDDDGDDDLAAGRWFDRPRIYENTGTTFTTTPVWQSAQATVVEELAWVDVDARNAYQGYVEQLATNPNRRLYYTSRHPLYSIDSVQVDGVTLTNDLFCYDLVSGWVTVGVPPQGEVELYYRYSSTNDLAVANWGEVNDIYLNTTDCCGRYTGGFTGNTDCDSEGKRNLADITILIDRIYISKVSLCCEDNGNVDGDTLNKLGLADITRLIDHVYISKVETAPCQ